MAATIETVEFYSRKHGRRFHPGKEIIGDAYFTMYFQKHSFLATLFNRLVLQLLTTGLIEHWTREFHYDYSKHNSHRNTNQPIVLTLEHIQGILLVVSILYVISLLVFFVELFFHNICIQLSHMKH